MSSNYPIYPKLSAIPNDLLTLNDYAEMAVQFMPPEVFEYVDSGAGEELTLHGNHAVFEDYQVYNRVLTDLTHAHTYTKLLGQTFRHPILLAPVAHQGLVHEQAELATAQGADAVDAGLVLSTLATANLEAVAEQTASPKWFQLYFQTDRADTLALVRRAEDAGYTALVVTVDVPINGLRYRVQRAGFTLPLTAQDLDQTAAKPIELSADDSVIFQGMMRTAPQWRDLDWLRRQTSLPILLKGVSHPDDAQRALDSGLQGVVVSNHGGRGLDRVPASLALLPAIRNTLGDDATVLLDGGIRSGADVFISLALGADAVLIGRPQIYALAIAGALGVAHMLKLLRNEFELTMALTGCAGIEDITPSSLFRH
ncbi:alpha-hydroxy-acid oxidizing enzyme [Arenicella chitinivorans]|uniref:Alpha-hydroxy-acid oxidizing enzyme n=1 Tax=Arenicella chitinivorans TaxID=1329800 RepID=A0A918VJ65_9GAMM|nr:alpha-hydroxy acid oxidase [Arenicella chitinivorans]GHA00329.1 alpha-hydroxy-acid oxidizing enzyme [Arenicella chitinivorans]